MVALQRFEQARTTQRLGVEALGRNEQDREVGRVRRRQVLLADRPRLDPQAVLDRPCRGLDPAGIGALVRLDGAGAPPGPCAPEVCGKGARAWLAGAPLDVNLATARELEAIPGVGPSLARAILAERARRGRFEALEELDDVDGVGPKTLAKLRGFLAVR